MTAGRLCLIVAAILLAIAGLLAFGVFKGPAAEGFALFGFAFWAVAGAV